MTNEIAASTCQATVVATFSRRMQLRLPDGSRVYARIKGKTLKAVCGDIVVARRIQQEQDWLITSICGRRNQLARPNLRGKTEVLAANVDMLLVTVAPIPEPDWFVVDRYLCAAENMRAEAMILFNKSDLGQPGSEFVDYAAIGYETLQCSAQVKSSVHGIALRVGSKTAILVGQSGVGKSSIINALGIAAELRTSRVSDKSREGRHTTVNSAMLELPSGGHLIDSPGVRDYAPALSAPEDVLYGFREIAIVGRDCRFSNCRHLREPGCAVKSALENSAVSPRRYESYRRLLILTEKLRG